MSSKKRNRFLIQVAGAERAGKTWWISKFAEKYVKTQGSVIAYNYGKDDDFPEFDEDGERKYFTIEPLTYREHIQLFYMEKDARSFYKANPQIEYFKITMDNGEEKIHHFRDFNRLFYKQMVRVPKIPNRPEETGFFKALYLYVSASLLILDDCRDTFRYGLNDGHIQLFSRKNHTGKKSSFTELKGKGIDVVTIAHNIDHSPESLWDYTHKILLFLFPFKPTYKNFNNKKLIEIIDKAREYLDKAPKYTCLEIHVQGENRHKVKNVTLKD